MLSLPGQSPNDVTIYWEMEVGDRLSSFYRNISSMIYFCYNLFICSNMRWVDSCLMWDLLKEVLSHSNEIYCFPLTGAPWSATRRNLISERIYSAEEVSLESISPVILFFPHFVQASNEQLSHWNRNPFYFRLLLLSYVCSCDLLKALPVIPAQSIWVVTIIEH